MAETSYGVIVGYDGSSEADRAVVWAAVEASLRGLRLTVCHAWQLAYGGMMVAATEEFERSAAEVVDRGVQRARAAVPGLDVHPLLARDFLSVRQLIALCLLTGDRAMRVMASNEPANLSWRVGEGLL